jgi:hypothetical protein
MLVPGEKKGKKHDSAGTDRARITLGRAPPPAATVLPPGRSRPGGMSRAGISVSNLVTAAGILAAAPARDKPGDSA